MPMNRRISRLKTFDYTQDGAYFVTICTHNRESIFGTIYSGEMWLSRYGNVVIDEWRSTEQKRDYVMLDAFVVMPNHFHAIVFIQNSPSSVGTWRAMSHKFSDPVAKSLSSIIGGFKSAVTKEINRIRNKPGSLVWQSRFYEHIIRDERDLNIHREYIINNPAKWSEDEENPLRNPKT